MRFSYITKNEAVTIKIKIKLLDSIGKPDSGCYFHQTFFGEIAGK
jgi:hypothetical protein